MFVYGIDHVQLAIPIHCEGRARDFYVRVLGFTEVPKPTHLLARGGVWFESGTLRVHLGADPDFVPARKAHPAFLVRGLPELAARCEASGCSVYRDTALDGYDRVYVFDPFGNRIELMESTATEGEADKDAK